MLVPHESSPHERCSKYRRLTSCSRILSDNTKVTRALVASSGGCGLRSRQTEFPIPWHRYFIRIPTFRQIAEVNKEKTLWVHPFRMPPDDDNSTEMEVKVPSSSQQDTDSTSSQSAGYRLEDAIVGESCYLLLSTEKDRAHGRRRYSS